MPPPHGPSLLAVSLTLDRVQPVVHGAFGVLTAPGPRPRLDVRGFG